MFDKSKGSYLVKSNNMNKISMMANNHDVRLRLNGCNHYASSWIDWFNDSPPPPLLFFPFSFKKQCLSSHGDLIYYATRLIVVYVF